jgi:peptidoglycan hydrolase-like protein with peptidoglycan-binding domain
MRVVRWLAVLLALAGLAAGILVLRSRPPRGNEGEPIFATAPLERQTLRQTTVVRGTVQREVIGVLRLATAGRVTSVDVTPGDDPAAGATLLRVDGRPVVAVGGQLPLWRDLEMGATGEDVHQLEHMLASEGFDPGTVDTTFRSGTESALKAWQAAHGFDPDGVFRAGDALVAAWPARVGQVGVSVGDFVDAGTEALTLTASTLSVLVDLTPSDRLRTREGQTATVELSARGAVASGRVATVGTAPISGGGETAGAETSDEAAAATGGREGQESINYRATLTLDEPLDAVEGAQVRVSILLEEAKDVLTAPVAAVVADGRGSPIVRVLRLDGTIEQVPVGTGLAQGAFVEVKGNLRAGTNVVIGETST